MGILGGRLEHGFCGDDRMSWWGRTFLGTCFFEDLCTKWCGTTCHAEL